MLNYKEQIEKYINKEIESKLGKIDIDIFEITSVDVLYYLFPLIERTIVEILSFFRDTEIEWYEQGKFRTLKSIIDCEENKKYLPKNIIDHLNYFYCDQGLRNLLMHYRKGIENISVPVNEIECVKELFCVLLLMYREALESINQNFDEMIQKI